MTADDGPASPPRLRRSAANDRRLLGASSLTFASRVFARLAQLIFLVIAARLLSLDEFASYSYLLVLAVTFSMLADTGVALAASREVSAGHRSVAETFSSGVPVAVFGAVLGAATMLGFVAVASGPDTSPVLAALAAAFVGVNLMSSYCMTMLRAVGRFGTEAGLQAGGGVSFLLLGTAAAAAGHGIALVLVALLVREVILGLLAFRVLRPELATGSPRPPRDWRPLLRMGIKMGLASTGLAVVTRAGILILGNASSAKQVAWYSAPSRIADAALVFSLTAGYSLLPGLSHIAVTDIARTRALLRKVLVLSVAITAPCAAIGVAAARPLLTFLFGGSFAQAAGPGRILLAGLPVYALLGISWYGLLAIGAERALMGIACTGAVASVAGGLLVIPGGEGVGAAWVYVLALAGTAAGCLAVLARLLRSTNVSRPRSEADVVVA